MHIPVYPTLGSPPPPGPVSHVTTSACYLNLPRKMKNYMYGLDMHISTIEEGIVFTVRKIKVVDEDSNLSVTLKKVPLNPRHTLHIR